MDRRGQRRWSDPGNWDVAPVSGNDLVFPAGAANKTNTNDIASLIIYGNLTLSDNGYVIGGNSIGLTGTVDATQSTGADTINTPLAFGVATASVSVDQNGASLVLGGAIAGTAGLTKTGAGLLDLTGANNYTGTTTVSAGVLNVDSAQSGSPVAVSPGARLGGAGTVGTITSNLGIVQPGNGTAPAVLTDAGDLNLGTGSNFNIIINGTAAGSSGFSQLGVNGQVNLNGAEPDGHRDVDADGQHPIHHHQQRRYRCDPRHIRRAGRGGHGHDRGPSVPDQLCGRDQQQRRRPDESPGEQRRPLGVNHLDHLRADRDADGDDHGVRLGLDDHPSGTVEFFNGSTSLGTATLNSSGVGTIDRHDPPRRGEPDHGQLPGRQQLHPEHVNGDDGDHHPVHLDYDRDHGVHPHGPGPAGQPDGHGHRQRRRRGTHRHGPVLRRHALAGLDHPDRAAATGPSTAILRTTSLGLGTHSITATYSGDGNYSTSTTATPVNQVVSQAGSQTTFTMSPNPSTIGQAVTLTATVVSLSPGATVSPTGTVQFFNGATSLGTVPVNSAGVATRTTTAMPLGTPSITATYSGDTNFTASTAAGQTQTVRTGAGVSIAISAPSTATRALARTSNS